MEQKAAVIEYRRRCAAVNPSFASIHRPPWTICYADKRGAARVQILHSAGRIVAAVERDRRRNEKGDMDRLRAERNSRTVHCPCLALYVTGHVRGAMKDTSKTMSPALVFIIKLHGVQER